MLGYELLERALGPGTQLGHNLTSAEGTQPSTGFDGLALGVGVQEASGVEITRPRGVQQGT